MSATLSFFARYILAIRVYFKLLFDAEFAGRVHALYTGRNAALPPAPDSSPKPPGAMHLDRSPRSPPATESALLLLAMLQREGRLLDFLQQDVTSFSDQDVGAAARVVHEGCRKALADHAEIESVRSEDEGSSLKLDAGYDATTLKLTGNVGGSPPHQGVLRHKGWRVKRLTLPSAVGDADLSVIAPAEVEL